MFVTLRQIRLVYFGFCVAPFLTFKMGKGEGVVIRRHFILVKAPSEHLLYFMVQLN